jgi:hypothetical protein
VGTEGAALPGEGQIQAFAVLAHPADLAGGDAGHEGVGFDVMGDDGAGGDEGVFAQGDATDQGGVGADGGAFLNPGCGGIGPCG